MSWAVIIFVVGFGLLVVALGLGLCKVSARADRRGAQMWAKTEGAHAPCPDVASPAGVGEGLGDPTPGPSPDPPSTGRRNGERSGEGGEEVGYGL